MRLYLLSLRGLIALALIVSLIGVNNFSGVEAKKEVEKTDDDDSGSEKQPSEQTTTKSPKVPSDEESPKPDEKKSDESEDEGSRSAAAAAAAASAAASADASAAASAAASASASASASADASAGAAGAAGAAAAASTSAVAEAPKLVDVGAGSSASSSSSSAAAVVETEEITEVTTTTYGSRSGLKEGSSDKKKDKASSDKESEDEESDEEEGKSRSASESVDKDKDTEDGSRSGLPDFIAKATSGFGMNLFRNISPRNNTIVLSMKSNFSTGSSSAEATIGPALILNRNGTKMISERGTVRPVTDDSKAKELVDKAKKDPKSFKLETFESVSEYSEKVVQGKGGITSSTHRDMIISGPTTTKAPASTVKPASSTGGPVPVSTTMKPVPSTTKKSELLATTTKAPSTVAPSIKPPVCPTCAPCPTGAANVTPKQGGCGGSPVLSDFQASDKLLAVVVTNKGHFKGRRINAKAIETIMKEKLEATPTQIEKGITISPNNSFVFPAGHYYFPHPVRVAGFQSP